MRFRSLSISNIRAVRTFEIDDLKDFIVIAGQNGCGKSCVFDAIRLLKSVYGGYQTDEYLQWFGEFSINPQDAEALKRLFRDGEKPIEISATIEFAKGEIDFIKDHAEELVQALAWQEVTGQRVDYYTFSRMAIATQLRQYGEAVDAAAGRLSADVRQALLQSSSHTLSLQITPDGFMYTSECKPAEVAFQAYRPDALGVIEFHSASRAYTRQALGGINLDVRTFADQRRQQALYNWQAKYQNVKTELATSYLRNLISQQSTETPEGEDLNETLEELFQTFFPDKAYKGVRPSPQGNLDFPVRLSTGELHDIDDLSSGEKEILYGYLRLKNSIPRNSVILLDEPELHINPSLLQGFTDFYYRHLGMAQGNQLWLVTHSDTLLRQAVGNINYRVYHMMLPSVTRSGQNQAAEVVADDDVDRVIIDLVGDLASYHPHGKVVIFEGESENGFDVNMVRRLFPDFARRVNPVSGGPKRRVRDLYRVLAESVSQAGIKNRFFTVVDRDADPFIAESSAQEFTWDVYHIENYLLDPDSVRAATVALLGRDRFPSDDDVLAALRDCARELVDRLVLERTQREINDELMRALKIGASPNSKSLAEDLKLSVANSVERVGRLGEEMTVGALRTRIDEYRGQLETSLSDGTWISEFPGRLVLRRFAAGYCSGVDSIVLSNVILDKMVERGVAPMGMKNVLQRILEA